MANKKAEISSVRRELRRSLFELRREYFRLMKKPRAAQNNSGKREWLLDNYYLLSREGTAALKSLRSCPALPAADDGTPRLYNFYMDYSRNRSAVSAKAVAGALSNFLLTTAETERLELFWITALLITASRAACGKNRDGAVFLGYAINSLRELKEIDFDALSQELCSVDKIFRKDPSGIYSQMDEKTRADYRRRAAKAAQKCGCSEAECANEILKQAREEKRHIGFFLETFKKNRRGELFMVLEGVLPLIMSIVAALAFRDWRISPLLFLPLWEIFRVPLERLSLRSVQPYELPRMEPDSPAALSQKTLIVLSTLLPKLKALPALEKQLLDIWHSGGGQNIRVCALMDFAAADTPEKAGDTAEIRGLRRLFARLEKEAPGAFYIALRPRKWCKTQGNYCGRERKRGAILELIQAVKADESSFLLLLGERNFLRECDYLLALDADTELPFKAAQDFTAVAAHPLNTPVIDRGRGRVVSGYGIIAPRMVSRRGKTPFARLLGGSGGFSAYESLASERYQDLFGSSIFAGKGLINIHACAELMPNAFPNERILSHDVLEGGILRCGYDSALSAADSCPGSAGAYFARLSRWLRGDIQNLPEIFKKNALPKLTKWQLIDNLRRALTPITGLLCTLFCVTLPMPSAFILLVCGILTSCAAELYSACAGLLRAAVSNLTGHSTGGRSPSLNALSRAGLLVMMLPQTAWTCFTSICLALWRMCVTKRNLLEWQTAAQSERNKHSLSWGQVLPCLIAAVPLLFFGSSEAKLLGLSFLMYPLFAFVSARERKSDSDGLSPTQRDTVESYAAATWRYFEEYTNAENNYLPPDNVQETPVFAVAQRTSPTNIGLYMLSCLAARDMGLIDTSELSERLEQTLTSTEKLERYRGHLLNWYSTASLKPLFPRYVSTVDSGNMLCAITALREGLREYLSEEPLLANIIARLEGLAGDCELDFLYNGHRRLFSIGYDLERGTLSNSYYDLFMSEARMTGYYAVANGIVPRKHWGALGRLLARSYGRTGALSWTGTLFEYFMPQLFLPAQSGSFTRACLAFCLAEQQRRTRKSGYPWGISESGFFAFDHALNYQYKAHGVQKLGLKRGLDSELVIAPYASFLALPYAPKSALSNLFKLEKMGMTGPCGFYEAADFTPSRSAGQDYAVVRSYMAHHAGMSFLACLNALQGNILQKRFMRNPIMSGAKSLLEEQNPQGAPLFKDAVQRKIPQPRERTQSEIRVFTEANPANPHVQILTNGEYTSILADTGAGTAVYGGVNVTRHSADLIARPCGVFARFVYEKKDGERESLPFARMLGEAKGARFSAEFAHDHVGYMARNQVFQMRCHASVHPRLPAEIRRYKIKNMTNEEIRGELRIYLEPSLIAQSREDEHPAFAKLFVTEEYDSEHGAMLFTRNPRGKEPPTSLAIGLAEDNAFSCAFERGLFVGPAGFADLLCDSSAFVRTRGNPDVCAALCVPISVSAKSTRSITLLMCVASGSKEALRALLMARADSKTKQSALKFGTALFPSGAEEDVLARRILPHIFYSQAEQCEQLQNSVRSNTLRGRGTLWSLGISGDYPIIYLPVQGENKNQIAAGITPYLRIAARLAACGLRCDLVLAWHEDGDYFAPLQSILSEQIYRESLESANYIFSVNTARLTETEQNALKAAATFIATREVNKGEKPTLFKPFILHSVKAIEFNHGQEKPPLNLSSALTVQGGFFGGASFYVNQKKPKRPWCWVLANPSFGTMVSEKSLGYSWAINCRENRLTPWENDPCTDNRGERLLVKIDGKVYDLLAGASCAFSPSGVSWQGSAGGVEYSVRVSVPERGMIKQLRLELVCKDEKRMSAVYYTEPVLGVNRAGARQILGEPMEDGAVLRNKACTIAGYCAIRLDGGANILCFDRAEFWSGLWHTGKLLPLNDNCVAVGRSFTLKANEKYLLDFSLSWAAKRSASLQQTQLYGNKADLTNDEQPLSTILTSNAKKLSLQAIVPFLKHQIISSRLWGRTGFHQSSGAYGFRDQLQDACALVWSRPKILHRQILRCCAVQFIEGDVLHWWHSLPNGAGGLRGVRTRCSDDMLWLAYALAHYLREGGDYSILDLPIAYLKADVLRDDEIERYFNPQRSNKKEDVYQHAIRAIQYCMSRAGEHGLPLFGTGDWNDSFDEIGAKGRGESVWLGMFLTLTLEMFAPICEKKGDKAHAVQFREYAATLRKNIDINCWDGDHYIRGWYDDGTALGVQGASACAIDSLTQSFAVFAQIGDAQRRRRALESAYNALVDKENCMIKLYTPPFDRENGADSFFVRRPGYAAAYPPGIRENGGQYTHAAAWLAMAFAQDGQRERAFELLKLINPAEICRNKKSAERYGGEPYALAGDVSAAEGIEGRAGWTLYTGSTAWFIRAMRELGLQIF